MEVFGLGKDLLLKSVLGHYGQEQDISFFLLFTALSHHMARVHNRNTNCETCNKKYNTRCSINNHPREYVEPTEFHQCPQCQYNTCRKSFLTKHLRRKHGKPEKCKHCDKLFRSDSHLDSHMKEKHGSTEYHCPHCDYVSCIQSRLDAHVKNVHTR